MERVNEFKYIFDFFLVVLYKLTSLHHTLITFCLFLHLESLQRNLNMWRYLISCLVFIFLICTPSNQSPQSSFFGWPLSETKVLETDSQITSDPPSPNKDVSQSSQLPAKDKLGFEVVSPKPEILTNLPENVNSTPFNAPTLLQKDNLTSGLTSYLSDEISSFLTTSVVFLGAALGRDGCDLKAACLAGTLVPRVQGRDIAVVAAEPLVPEVWKGLYEAAKSSMIQGQDCSKFDCV